MHLSKYPIILNFYVPHLFLTLMFPMWEAFFSFITLWYSFFFNYFSSPLFSILKSYFLEQPTYVVGWWSIIIMLFINGLNSWRHYANICNFHLLLLETQGCLSLWRQFFVILFRYDLKLYNNWNVLCMYWSCWTLEKWTWRLWPSWDELTLMAKSSEELFSTKWVLIFLFSNF